MKQLRASIDSLAHAIDQLDDEDEAGRARLQSVVDGLNARLERHASEEPSPTVQEDAESGLVYENDNAILEMVSTYEARHPQMTLMLNDIMMRLASMGI